MGNVSEACQRVFGVLRSAESAAIRRQGVDFVLLPDLRAAAKQDERLQALWERLHRAASGQFLYRMS